MTWFSRSGRLTVAFVLVSGCFGRTGLDDSTSELDDDDGGGGAPPITTCGNGRANPGEECDGSDLRGATCTSIAPGNSFSVGTLRCTPSCRFDTSDCTGVVNTGGFFGAAGSFFGAGGSFGAGSSFGGTFGAGGTLPPCPSGQKRCGGICVNPAPLVGCSLDGCAPCPAPPDFSLVFCDGTICSLECDLGRILVDGSCELADAGPSPESGTFDAGTDTGDLDAGSPPPRDAASRAETSVLDAMPVRADGSG